jgi:membrane protein YdbS with pleckstrin-like domain
MTSQLDRLNDTAASDLGAYAFLLGEDSPQSRATLALIGRVRGTVRPSASAYLGRALTVAIAALAVGLLASLALSSVHGLETVRGPDPLCAGLPAPARAQCEATLGTRERTVRVRPISPLDYLPVVVLTPLGALLVLAGRIGSTLYEIDAGRLRVTRGLLLRRARVVELFRVRSVEVRQGLLNQLTGDGALVLELDAGRPLVLLGIAKNPALDRLGADLQDLVLTLRRTRALQGIPL